MQIKDLVCPLD